MSRGFLIAVVLAISSLQLLCVPASADVSVTLYRPACCKKWSCFSHKRQFPEWENNGVSNGRQKDTAFTYPWFPSRSSIRRIAIFAAGQQTVSGSGQYSNVVASSKPSWRNFCTTCCSTSASLDSRGLAGKFIEDSSWHPGWSSSNTLVISAHDLQFNHMLSKSNKNKALESWFDWVSNRVYWNNIDYVYVAGSSRGGCFAMRFGDYIMRKSSTKTSTRFILQSVDGVCKESQSEFGTYSPRMNNPITSKNFKLYQTNIPSQFPSNRRANLCAFQIAGGDEVTGVGVGVNAFAHAGSSSNPGETKLSSGSHTFYRQVWTDKDHTDLGRSYSLPVVSDLQANFQTCMNSWN